jgi:hypothetical protein
MMQVALMYIILRYDTPPPPSAKNNLTCSTTAAGQSPGLTNLLSALYIRQFRSLMVLARLVKAKGLVREQLLAHCKTGSKKGEPDKGC